MTGNGLLETRGPGCFAKAILHSRSVSSLLPERAQRPSGLHETEVTSLVCPSKVQRHLPVNASHSRNVRSELPERTKQPSGLHDTECTQPLWPSKMRRHLPVDTSHSRNM